MENRQGKLAIVAAALVALLLAPVPSTADGQPGTASGSLTLDAVTVPLTHAYASAQPGFFDKKTEDVRVLLSDVPLPDSALTDVFELIHLARDGKVHVVEVVIDAKGEPISGGLYAKKFDGMVSAAGMHKFAQDRWERTLIAGRLWVDGSHEFMNVTWHYDAMFSASIPRLPKR